MAKAKKKERAKWGTKTRYGQPVDSSNGKYVKLAAPGEQINKMILTIPDKCIEAKVIFAALLAHESSKTWSEPLRKAISDYVKI